VAGGVGVCEGNRVLGCGISVVVVVLDDGGRVMVIVHVNEKLEIKSWLSSELLVLG
jgi:hypothetical protein